MARTSHSLTLADRRGWPGVVARVDLSDVEFVDPFGLVMAACAGERAGRAGQVSYRLPTDPSASHYCVRMGLVEALAKGGGLEPDGAPGSFATYDRSDVLAELHRLDGWGPETPPVAGLVYDRLAERSGPAEAAFCCVAEACNNVGDHAESAGYAAAQVYKRGSADERVVLAIGDPGRGMARSLAARHGDLADSAAIRLVVEQGASSTRDVGTGIGSMVSIVDDLGGTLVLWSGTAALRRHGRRSHFTEGVEFPGTAVGIEIPCRRGGR